MTASLLPWADPSAWRLLGQFMLGAVGKEGGYYLVAAFTAWLLLHVWLKQRLAHRLIAGWPGSHDMRREMAYSASTVLIFAALGAAVFALLMNGHVFIYRRPDRFGWLWLFASLPLLIVWHDTYFYWTHRLMHSRWLFARVHGVHHRSRNPSPWAAYAFHPLEAVINGLVTPLALLAVPLHWSVVVLFSLHQIIRNVHGHLAVEVMPAGFARHGFWGWFTTTTHHHLHHETARGNYGLWFTWWDRLAGTERPEYLQRFEAATRPRPQPAASAPPLGKPGFESTQA